MLEIIGGGAMAVGFFLAAGKCKGVVKAICIVLGILSIFLAIHGVTAVFY